MVYYKDYFRGKIVYCNCDDPTVSNFWVYFSMQFKYLGLNKLMATCYKSSNPDLFSDHTAERSYHLEYFGDRNDNRVPDPEEIGIKYLRGDGDFRSPECIEFLKEADIVVTNPPFSLFREYLAQLIQYDKKFLILGNQNTTSTKDVFPLIRDGRVWLGASIKSGDREFGVPSHYPLTASGTRIDENGNRFVRVKGVRWYTNLEHKKRNESLILWKRYSPEEYDKYDNYDAIEVGQTKLIPVDYNDTMGVPITFLDKHNPDQFGIVGLTSSAHESGYRTKIYTKADHPEYSRLNGDARPVIRRGDGSYQRKYPRLLIQRIG